mmetsp:Transcript_36298/g.94828  ORF Transcript_36298/g.94828 Transcript_36298/m.94828 type:complete len:83 (-) Transcript_36298:136-384(-)
MLPAAKEKEDDGEEEDDDEEGERGKAGKNSDATEDGKYIQMRSHCFWPFGLPGMTRSQTQLEVRCSVIPFLTRHCSGSPLTW